MTTQNQKRIVRLEEAFRPVLPLVRFPSPKGKERENVYVEPRPTQGFCMDIPLEDFRTL